MKTVEIIRKMLKMYRIKKKNIFILYIYKTVKTTIEKWKECNAEFIVHRNGKINYNYALTCVIYKLD